MGLVVKHNRAEYTHENEQFRRIASSLKILFQEKNWDGILIGNPYNENYPRFRADAILLYNYGLIIIDFKVYKGTIKIPIKKEEFRISQWYIESDDEKKKILIKAGKKFINPFIQLDSYRNAFKEIVRNEIQLSNLINENHICILNIFSGPIFIENNVHKEFTFYKITDEDNLGTFLYDYSSDNVYSKEAEDILLRIFNAEEWLEYIELPKPFLEQKIEINKNVETIISDFLIKADESGILVLCSTSDNERDNWLQHILSISSDFKIPQTETWIYSARIGRKVSKRSGIEFLSLFNTIYSINKIGEIKNQEQENELYETEELLTTIPLNSDHFINTSALIILHEAHLVTNSMHQSELLQFGSGKLLEDLLKFLNLEQTKRKLICIGDPYSLTYGKQSESAINIDTLKKSYKGKINIYKQPLLIENEGKLGLRSILIHGIENNIFNYLKYPWKENNLQEINKDNIKDIFTEWFSAPLESEPYNIVMVYSNNDAKEINKSIKNIYIKNGTNLAKNDLLYINNNVNIYDETGLSPSIKLYKGMFVIVEEVGQSITKPIAIKQSNTPISLTFTEVKIKCLSTLNKLTTKVWLLDNFLQNDNKLSNEEKIAFRVFLNQLVSEKIEEQPFENSYEYRQLMQDEEYKELCKEIENLNANNQKLNEEIKNKLKQKEDEKNSIIVKYKKKHKKNIFLHINQNDPLINAIHASYGWALTVHKCIGLTFTNAILYANQGDNRGITNADYYSWLYSAVLSVSGILFVYDPQFINPLIKVNFEDTTSYNFSKNKKAYLSFNEYIVNPKYLEKLPKTLKENVKASICELAQQLEKLGYLLESTTIINDFLTKVNFSIPSKTNKNLIIAIYNKGAKDKWVISSIKIEKSEGENETKINECIESLFYSNEYGCNFNQLNFPSDFRAKIYEKWNEILFEKGYNLYYIEAHQYQDVFYVTSIDRKAKFRVWYSNDGFITKIQIIEKSDEKLGEELKSLLIYEK